MSKQKPGTSKAKEQGASSAATDVIPPEIRELLGPSPVVDIAEEPIFERLLAGAVTELRPSGMIEWSLVFDFVVTTWEIRQLREYKSSFLKIENAKYSVCEDPDPKDEYSIPEGAGNRLFAGLDLNKLTAREFVKIFAERSKLQSKNQLSQLEQPKNKNLKYISVGESHYDRAFRLSQVISKQARTIDELQKMTLMLEKRRDTLLRDLDRRQVARRERETQRPQRDRNATDIESRV